MYERERERDRVCVCVCVCERARERESEMQSVCRAGDVRNSIMNRCFRQCWARYFKKSN